MKPKKILSRLSILVIVFYSLLSCSSDPQKELAPELKPVGDPALSIAADGGNYSIGYRLVNPIEGVSVKALTNAGWIDGFEYAEGKVTFQATANPTTEPREAEITVTYSTEFFTVKAVQEGTPAKPEIEILTEREIKADFTGGPFEIGYAIVNPTSGGELRVAAGDADWITDIVTTDETVKFNVTENGTSDSRETTITLTYEDASAEIVIKQKGKQGGAYDEEFRAPSLDGFYYGDTYSPGAGNYWFFLSDKGLDEAGNVKPDGTYFLIDLYADIASDANNARIPTGVYTLDPAPYASCAKGTFSRQNSRFYTTDENGNTVNPRVFDTATLKITESGDGYLIELNCMTNEENKLWYVYYSGDTLLENQAN